MIIEFDDNLITGNETIDTQHKELIDRIKQFVTSCEKNEGSDKACQMLDYLIEYTNFHFSAEEQLQKDVKYPGFDTHKEKHEEYKATLAELSSSLKEAGDSSDALVDQIKESVVDWLFNHIKLFDRSVAEYIYITENPDRL